MVAISAVLPGSPALRMGSVPAAALAADGFDLSVPPASTRIGPGSHRVPATMHEQHHGHRHDPNHENVHRMLLSRVA